MIDWKRVPWSLWLFCATLLTGWVMIEVDTHGTVVGKVLFAALMLAWIYYLLKAVEWLWILTVALSVLALVPFALIAPFDWLGAVQSLFGLALLLLPMTRRYFADGTPAADA
ncbi:MAG: hypothetical protein ACRDPE_18280 [Solirubrobacterales bacterium]